MDKIYENVSTSLALEGECFTDLQQIINHIDYTLECPRVSNFEEIKNVLKNTIKAGYSIIKGEDVLNRIEKRVIKIQEKIDG